MDNGGDGSFVSRFNVVDAKYGDERNKVSIYFAPSVFSVWRSAQEFVFEWCFQCFMTQWLASERS